MDCHVKKKSLRWLSFRNALLIPGVCKLILIVVGNPRQKGMILLTPPKQLTRIRSQFPQQKLDNLLSAFGN